jgi:GTP-binding protein YchF
VLTIGIVGLPNVGKSTLFNALTKSNALAANYPFATIEPNVGIVPVPDSRLPKLAELYHTDKIVPATVRFVDIAGLVSGASQGEGLGNQFLSHIRSTSVIVEVVRAFSDKLVTHVNDNVDPAKDIDIIQTELVLADLQTINKRIGAIQKEAKANPKLSPILELMYKAHSLLDAGKTINNNMSDEEIASLSDLQLLTAKPFIFVFNVDEETLADRADMDQLSSIVSPASAIFICAKLESELTSLDDSDAAELRESYNLHQSGLETLIKTAYQTLGLNNFLTAGEKEIRAWTIPIGTTAPKAAGVIHGDFERGFIAAEIVNYNDLISLGSIAACRAAGKVRTEGKSYIMQPDDVVEFRFNI